MASGSIGSLQTLVINLQLRTTELERQLQEIQNRTSRAGQNAGRQFTSGFNSGIQGLSQVGSIIGGLIGASMGSALMEAARAANEAEAAVFILAKTAEYYNVNVEKAQAFTERFASAMGVMPEAVNAATTQLIRAGYSLEEIQAAFTGGAASALAAGKSVQQGVEAVAMALAQGQSIYLNQIGIAENIGLAMNKAATAAADQGEAAQEAARRNAALNIILKATRSEVESLPILMSGFAGSTNTLNLAMKELQLNLGQAVIPELTRLISRVAEVVGKFNDLSPATKEAIGTGALAGAGILGVVAAIGIAIPLVNALTASIKGLWAALLVLAKHPIVLAVTALAGLATYFVITAEEGTKMGKAVDLVAQGIYGAGQVIIGVLRGLTSPLAAFQMAVARLYASIDALKAGDFAGAWDNAKEIVSSGLTGLTDTFGKGVQQVNFGWDALMKSFQGQVIKPVESTRQAGKDLQDALGEMTRAPSLEDLIADYENYSTALEASTKAGKEAAKATADSAKATADSAKAAKEAKPDVDKLTDSVRKTAIEAEDFALALAATFGLPKPTALLEAYNALGEAGYGATDAFRKLVDAIRALDDVTKEGLAPLVAQGDLTTVDALQIKLNELRALGLDLTSTYFQLSLELNKLEFNRLSLAADNLVASLGENLNTTNGLINTLEVLNQVGLDNTSTYKTLSGRLEELGRMHEEAAAAGAKLTESMRLTKQEAQDLAIKLYAGVTTGQVAGDAAIALATTLLEEAKALGVSSHAVEMAEQSLAMLEGRYSSVGDKASEYLAVIFDSTRGFREVDESIDAYISNIERQKQVTEEAISATVDGILSVTNAMPNLNAAIGDVLTVVAGMFLGPGGLAAGISRVFSLATSLVPNLFSIFDTGAKKAKKDIQDIADSLLFVNVDAVAKTVEKQQSYLFGLFKVSKFSAQVNDLALGIAKGLESGITSGLQNATRAFLEGTANWQDLLYDGLREAVINAVTDAVIQSAVIKGALGDLLTNLTESITSGDYGLASSIVGQIGAAIPGIASTLETILAPLKDALGQLPSSQATSALSGGNSLLAPMLPPLSVPATPNWVNDLTNAVGRFSLAVDRFINQGLGQQIPNIAPLTVGLRALA